MTSSPPPRCAARHTFASDPLGREAYCARPLDDHADMPQRHWDEAGRWWEVITGRVPTPPARLEHLDWTCIVCGAVHPIDHAGLHLGSFMACCSCERTLQERSLSADARAVRQQTVTIPLFLAAELAIFQQLVTRGYVARATPEPGSFQALVASITPRATEPADEPRETGMYLQGDGAARSGVEDEGPEDPDVAVAEHATMIFERHYRECMLCSDEGGACEAGAELRLIMIDANDGTDYDGSDVKTGPAWDALRARSATIARARMDAPMLRNNATGEVVTVESLFDTGAPPAPTPARTWWIWRAWNHGRTRICDCGTAFALSADDAREIANMTVGAPHAHEVLEIAVEPIGDGR